MGRPTKPIPSNSCQSSVRTKSSVSARASAVRVFLYVQDERFKEAGISQLEHTEIRSKRIYN